MGTGFHALGAGGKPGIVLARLDSHFCGSITGAPQPHRGVDDETLGGGGRVLGIALEQAAGGADRLHQIGGGVRNGVLDRFRRHRLVAVGERIEENPAQNAVEAGGKAVEDLEWIIGVLFLHHVHLFGFRHAGEGIWRVALLSGGGVLCSGGHRRRHDQAKNREENPWQLFHRRFSSHRRCLPLSG